MSNRDRHADLKLPEKLTPELAEFIGIIVGDGHVGIAKRKKRKHVDYEIHISGHILDKQYMTEFVNTLTLKLFNIPFHKNIFPKHNVIVLRKRSKGICYFLRDIIGIPQRKDNITIPNCILTSNELIKTAFLRGLADADFCLTIKHKPNNYPVIHGTSKSPVLMYQCSEILNKLGILNYVRKESDYYEKRNKTYTRYRLYINGYQRVKLFMEQIGFRNPNKIQKYERFLKKI